MKINEKENYFFAAAFFALSALAAALPAKSRTLRPLYHPHDMQIEWLLCAAPQLPHFETRPASSA